MIKEKPRKVKYILKSSFLCECHLGGLFTIYLWQRSSFYMICNLVALKLSVICRCIIIISGGVFPHPPAVAQLCTLLPPPGCFRGPFVAVDMLMDVFSKIQLPETG